MKVKFGSDSEKCSFIQQHGILYSSSYFFGNVLHANFFFQLVGPRPFFQDLDGDPTLLLAHFPLIPQLSLQKFRLYHHLIYTKAILFVLTLSYLYYFMGKFYLKKLLQVIAKPKKFGTKLCSTVVGSVFVIPIELTEIDILVPVHLQSFRSDQHLQFLCSPYRNYHSLIDQVSLTPFPSLSSFELSINRRLFLTQFYTYNLIFISYSMTYPYAYHSLAQSVFTLATLVSHIFLISSLELSVQVHPGPQWKEFPFGVGALGVG